MLGRLHWLDMANSKLMMGLSILVGGVHVLLANVMDARRYADWRDGIASLGWASAVGGGLLFGGGSGHSVGRVAQTVGGVAIVLGLFLVVGYTAWREKPLKRLVQGLLGLTRISGAFGDILSYLRLFALGLASASLATAFNDMAAGIRDAGAGHRPVVGLAGACVRARAESAVGHFQRRDSRFAAECDRVLQLGAERRGSSVHALSAKGGFLMELTLTLGWIGLYAPLALGAIGSMIGCLRGGMAACGAMLEVERGYGRFVGVAAMPSSQTIYGIVVTMAFPKTLTAANSPGIFALGVLSGLALMLSAMCARQRLRRLDQRLQEQTGSVWHLAGPGRADRRLRGVRLRLRPGARWRPSRHDLDRFKVHHGRNH